MLTNFAELHTARVYFKGNDGDNKIRPVLIIDDSEDDLITIAEITSEEPKNPPKYFDNFKVEITGWLAAGLDKRSWVKCHESTVHRVPKDRVVKYIGVVEDNVIIEVLGKITNK